jgi:hypothetical protein
VNRQQNVKRGVAAVFVGAGQPKPTPDGEAMQTSRKSSLTMPATSTEKAATESLAQAGQDSRSQSDTGCRHLVAGKVKASYYLDPALVTRMKHLAIDLKKRDSDMVAEGLLEIIKKYEQTSDPAAPTALAFQLGTL